MVAVRIKNVIKFQDGANSKASARTPGELWAYMTAGPSKVLTVAWDAPNKRGIVLELTQAQAVELRNYLVSQYGNS